MTFGECGPHICVTCCGAPEGARAVSSCHQVLPWLRRTESDLSKGPQSEVPHWLSPFPVPTGAPFSLPALTMLVPGVHGCLFLQFNVPICGASACSQRRHRGPQCRHRNPCPRGSGRPKSSLGHCGQHLIPSEWFSALRPARERSRQLNLPTACLACWLQPAGDSFPQGGCSQYRLYGQRSVASQETCAGEAHVGQAVEGSRKVLHVGPGHSLVPLPSFVPLPSLSLVLQSQGTLSLSCKRSRIPHK